MDSDFWLYAGLAAVLGAFLWLFFRVYLPLINLKKMILQLERGETLHPWQADGTSLIRHMGRSLAALSYHYAEEREARKRLESQLSSLFREMDQPVAWINPDGSIQQANKAFEAFFSLSTPTTRRRLIELVQIYEVNELVGQALRSGEVEIDIAEFKVVTPKGLENRSGKIAAVPIMDESGKVWSVIFLAVDYSRLREMENAERNVVASVSHELRTPLAVFKGYLEALKERLSCSELETRQIIDTLIRNSNRLNHLVEDLLLLSRLESGIIGIEKTEVQIPQFLEQIKADFVRIHPEVTAIQISISPELELHAMDEFRMEQVFHNLIDNARRYSDSSRPIIVGAMKEASGAVRFYVKDFGTGIPSDKLGHIFERFYRVDRARSRDKGGTGLGLTIVKEIVTAHGGEIWAESIQGEGTTIHFRIPPEEAMQKTAIA
ncbi:MAG: sensor histidine kinase [Candidatus Methylacidiphilales bacterium]